MALILMDLETTGLDPWRHRIVSVSSCDLDLVPVSQYWSPIIRAKHYSFLAKASNTVVMQNSVFDLSFLIRNGFKIKAKIEDTMIGGHLLEPNERVDLGSLVKRYLWPVREEFGFEIDWNWKDKMDDYLKQHNRSFKRANGRAMSMQDIPPALLHTYGKKDSLYCLLVHFTIKAQLKAENLQKNYKLDMQIVSLVLKMWKRGVRLDTGYCREKIRELFRKNRKIIKKYPSINLGSPKAIGEKFLPSLGIKPRYFTEKGNIKTDVLSLRRYAKRDRRVLNIIDYRKNLKSVSSYFTSYLNLSHHGIVHPTFNVANAKTGRLSCSDPNLQQMKRSGGIREAYIVRPGYLVFCWDYDQIEMRLIACKSRDPQLLKIFKKGKDVHNATMSHMKLDRADMKEVLRGNDPRFVAKQLNYKLWYGMGIQAISNELLIPEITIRSLVDSYWQIYSWGKSFFDLVSQRAVAQGSIRDEYGRMYKPENQFAGYKCVNYLIQGAASTILKKAMVRVNPLLVFPLANMLLQIHDELVIEIKDDPKIYLPLVPRITAAMQAISRYEIPILTTVKWSRTNLGDLHPLSELKGFKQKKGKKNENAAV